ncbi:MAG: AMP-binding protein [Rhodobacteraceae bacterium]|nr:AMP-binding protein [Paracoccaceae bacterium]
MRWIEELIEAGDQAAIAIIDHDGARFTYADLVAMIGQLRDVLTEIGVRGGDRVLVVAENSASFAVAMLALAGLRAWPIPVNARMSADEIDAIRAHAGARAALFTPEASDLAAGHALRLSARPHGRLAAGEVLIAGPWEAVPEPVSVDPHEQVGALMYTTGTTSQPKAVMLTHANLTWNAETSCRVRGIRADDDILAVLPGSHIYCFGSAMLAAFHAGATVRFQPRFSVGAVLAAYRDGVTIMPAVPQMYQAIVEHLRRVGEKPDLPRLRLISSGGAPLDPDWKAGIEAFFGLPLHNGYGLTETSPSVSVTRPDRPRTDISVGEVVDGVEVLIDAPDQGGVGEVLIRGPNIMKGYYRNPDATRAAIRPDGFFRSGDLGRIGDEGELYIVGRLKELIIRSGFNVYPSEVEAMLTRHPAIRQAAVVGRQVAGNEEILAFLLTDGSVTEADVKDWLKDHLAAYKVPQRVLVVEEFPVAPSGKILKHRLIPTFAAQLADGVG